MVNIRGIEICEQVFRKKLLLSFTSVSFLQSWTPLKYKEVEKNHLLFPDLWSGFFSSQRLCGQVDMSVVACKRKEKILPKRQQSGLFSLLHTSVSVLVVRLMWIGKKCGNSLKILLTSVEAELSNNLDFAGYVCGMNCSTSAGCGTKSIFFQVELNRFEFWVFFF